MIQPTPMMVPKPSAKNSLALMARMSRWGGAVSDRPACGHPAP
jgi:hypothetical protein